MFVTKELLIASTKTLSCLLSAKVVAVGVIPYMGYLVGMFHCCLLQITWWACCKNCGVGL